LSFKKNLRDYLSIGSANLIVSISYGLFWLFLASILEKTEYGELGYLMAIANIGSAIAFLGVGKTIVVFEPKNENILPAAFIVVAISSSITAIIAYLISQNFFVSVLIIGMIIFGIVTSGIVSKKQYNEYSKNLIIRVIVTIGLSLLLLQFFGINGILFGYLIGTLFVLKNLKNLIGKRKIEFSTLRKRIPFTVSKLSITIITETLYVLIIQKNGG